MSECEKLILEEEFKEMNDLGGQAGRERGFKRNVGLTLEFRENGGDP